MTDEELMLQENNQHNPKGITKKAFDFFGLKIDLSACSSLDDLGAEPAHHNIMPCLEERQELEQLLQEE